MKKEKILCPRCYSDKVVKNGNAANGKPKHMCKDCHRQFVLNPKKQRISEEKKYLIDNLLLEKIPLAAIARAVGVSESWLQTYVNSKYG